MTMRTEYSVICDCGHEGNIKLTENDQPYSKMYQNYTPENLEGDSFHTISAGWEEVFGKMRIICPTCKKQLTIQHLKG